MARRSQFPVRSSRPKRFTSWLDGPLQSVVGISISSIVAWPVGLQILEDGITLVRTRGEALVRLNTTAGGLTDGFSGAIGLAVASENAFGIGVTGLMDPLADAEWDGWLWHHFFHISGPATQGGVFQRIEIDSKAMRKIAALDVIYGVISTLETGVEIMVSSAETRMLFKLS